MNIAPHVVKELRVKTGAGMMDCKKALVEAQGDLQKAVEVLRKQGLAIAQKKAGREALEGTIGHWLSTDGTKGLMIEVNCETDFVAKNDVFQGFVTKLAELAAQKGSNDLQVFLKLSLGGKTVEEAVTETIAQIGENIGVRRLVMFTANKGQRLAQYIHAGSKIGVMVLFSDPKGRLTKETAHDVAMHAAAMHPLYLRRSDVPEGVLAKEREIQLAQLKDQKKPQEILNKIVEGKLQKYFADVCLDEQIFVRDPEGKRSVAKFLEAINLTIRIEQFVRYQVGEVSS